MWCKASVLFIGGPFAVIYMHLCNFNLLLYFFQMTCMLGNLGIRSVTVTDIHMSDIPWTQNVVALLTGC
jgi:hypothetical protein